jgi:pyruvate dehydrogenase E2 component (dihydrolipoamide acetyltransferase)
MTEVPMPRLSDSMEEGTIVAWLRSDGDAIKRGDEIVEIETDKATMTYEAETDGFLHVVAEVGDTLPVGAMIAQLLAHPDELPPAGGPTPTPTPDVSVSSTSGDQRRSFSADGSGQGTVSAVLPRVKASPLARRLANAYGIELAALDGSGRGGRIVKADVLAAVGVGEAGAPPAPPKPAPVGKDDGAAEVATSNADGLTAKGEVARTELTRVQTVIARRMAEAKATTPDFAVTIEADVEKLLATRGELRGVADPLPSVNDFIVKAAARALRAHPRVNGSYRDGRFETYSRVNVGVAVASEDALVVPTIHDADSKALTEIARDTRRLAERVRTHAITPPELAGATFAVSNLGMFGVTRFTAVIDPPQAAILAVGAALPRFVPDEGGAPCLRRVMELTLSADHRIIYGADAAAFLKTVRSLLEQPLALLT